MKNLRFKISLSLALTLLVGVTSARAAVTFSSTSNSDQLYYDGDISATDLINVGQASLLSYTATGAVTQAGGANNGAGGFDTGTGNMYISDGNGSSVTSTETFLLNTDDGTGGSSTGYTITSFNSIAGYSSGALTSQNFFLSYETSASIASDPSDPWIFLGQFYNYDYYGNVTGPGHAGSATASDEVTVYNDTPGAPVATGVVGIQVQNLQATVIHEYDLFGSPTTVPEPATWALLLGGLGFLGFWLRRRRA